jgi:phospholipase C
MRRARLPAKRGESPFRRTRVLAVLAVCAALVSCASLLNSRFAGGVLETARGVEAGTAGITGTILDRTAGLLTVEDDRTATIYCVRVPAGQGTDLEPGIHVRVEGSFDRGVLAARLLQVTGGSPWPAPSTAAPAPAGGPGVQHVLVLMQENHSFDNYFGTFPGADGLPEGISVEGIAPFHVTSAVTTNPPHSEQAAQAAINGGRMDRFVSAEGTPDTMGYYDSRDVPNYWSYARRFALADRFFSSFAGPTLPNHLFAVAAQSGGVTRNSNQPAGGGYRFPSLPDALDSAGISWKCYVGQKDPWGFGPLNPLSGFPSLRRVPGRLASTRSLFEDLRSGTLPSVCWIFPSGEESEHPLTDVRIGMWYVTAVVNALMKSSAWQSTVLVITWDEYGGFFDHVPPPSRNGTTLGLRVPALVVSPFARPGFVDHTVYDVTSVLRCVEDRFGITPLTQWDRDAASIAGMLDSSPHPDPLLIASP